MGRAFTWKALSIAIGLALAAGVICLIAGNTDMASALFVVGAFEGLVGAVVVRFVSGGRRSEIRSTTL